MKAIGASFLKGEKQEVCVAYEGGQFWIRKDFSLMDGEEAFKAAVLPLNEVKVRFYSMPDVNAKQAKDLLRNRLEKDPMVDLSLTDFSFKKVSNGFEVHFFDQRACERLKKDHDYVTSSHQALFRYVKDYICLDHDLLLLVLEKESVYAFRFLDQKIDRYAVLRYDEEIEKELSLLMNTWGALKYAWIGCGLETEFEGKTEVVLQENELAFAIGAGIDALSEGVAMHTPLESFSFLKMIQKKGQKAFFLSVVLSFSLLFCVEQYRKEKTEVLLKEQKELEQLEPFFRDSVKTAPKVGLFLQDLQQSIEVHALNVVEFRYSLHPFEKKPIARVEFVLEGEESQVEMYEQSIKKARGALFTKMERDRSQKGFVFRSEILL